KAKSILNEVADAMKESDPKKRADAWKKAEDDLNNLYSDGADPGNVNDIAQTVFNAMYDALGDKDFKDTFQKLDLIPPDFATALSTMIGLLPGENTNNDAKDHSYGGPGWTHQRTMDWLKENGKPAPSGSGSGSSSGSSSA